MTSSSSRNYKHYITMQAALQASRSTSSTLSRQCPRIAKRKPHLPAALLPDGENIVVAMRIKDPKCGHSKALSNDEVLAQTQKPPLSPRSSTLRSNPTKRFPRLENSDFLFYYVGDRGERNSSARAYEHPNPSQSRACVSRRKNAGRKTRRRAAL